MTNQTDTPDDFDLSEFEISETATLDVLDVNNQPMLRRGQPVRIVLHGPGSVVFVRAEARVAAASQARALAALRGKAGKNDTEEQHQQRAEKLAAVTAGIENFPVPGGALALYGNRKLGYITSQVESFLADWANFKPVSARS